MPWCQQVVGSSDEVANFLGLHGRLAMQMDEFTELTDLANLIHEFHTPPGMSVQPLSSHRDRHVVIAPIWL